MDVFSLLVNLLILLTAVYMVLTYWTRKDLPPSPAISLPILGHLLAIDVSTTRQMQQWRAKVGDIFSLFLGGNIVVVLNGYGIIKEAFLKRGDEFSSRPFNYPDWVLGTPNTGTVFSSGANWKEQRTVALGILRTMGMGKNILAQRIQEEVSLYLDCIAKAAGEPQDIRLLTNFSVSNVICSVLIGQRFDYDDEVFQTIIEKIDYLVKNFAGLGPSLLQTFPVLHYLPGDLFHMEAFLRNKRGVREMFVEHFKQLKGGVEYNEDNLDNFIAHYTFEMKKRQLSGHATHLDEVNLSTLIEDLIIAGTETTSTTISWFILYIVNNPKIQEKMFHEIQSEVGTQRLPNMHDKNKLRYVNAVIMETQRIANIVPTGLPHTAVKDTTLRGFKIPEGTLMLANMTSVLFDKDIWGDDVEEFRPERFIDETGNLKHFEEFIPFSIGRRVCLGEALAKMELFLYISSLVQRFECLPPDSDQPPAIVEMLNITRMPAPYTVRMIERI